MRTVGEILKAVRLEKKQTYSEIEKETKIRAEYLELLEKNEFKKIPGGAPITKGFIKNYADYLGLNAGQVLAILRRDFLESKSGEIIPRGMVESLNTPKFNWNPKLTFIAGVAIIFLSLSFYLFWQYSSSFFAPKLEVFSPKEGLKTNSPALEISGKIDSDASLFINREMKIVLSDGTFSDQVSLETGQNEITIEAVSRRGKRSKITRTVEYTP